MKKQSKTKLGLRMNVLAELRNKDGKIISKSKTHNTVVTTGKVEVAKFLGALSPCAGFTYIAIGESESGDSVVVGDTALVNESDRALAIMGRNGNEATFEHTFSFGTAESFSIKEVGLFNSITPGGSIMFNRAIFSEKNVDFDTTLYILITITVG